MQVQGHAVPRDTEVTGIVFRRVRPIGEKALKAEDTDVIVLCLPRISDGDDRNSGTEHEGRLQGWSGVGEG